MNDRVLAWDGCTNVRDLGGLIICDFIDMRDGRNRREVERAFRDCKTTILEVRPVFVRSEKSTRGHVLVVMLDAGKRERRRR